MSKMNLKFVKSLVGCHVNIRLKDGSVLVNVLVVDVYGSRSSDAILYYMIPNKKLIGVPVREIELMEKLNPHLIKGFWQGATKPPLLESISSW